MSAWAIYIITNKVNAKQYVGITKNTKRRWSQHLRTNGSAPALHAAIKKYGADQFVFSHICDAFDFDAACDIETLLIKQHNTKAPFGYNITDGGDGVVGVSMTEEQKETRRQAHFKFVSGLTLEERSEKFGSFRGRKHSDETKAKIKASNLGKNLGRLPSDEARRKMSESQKKVKRGPLSEETKQKIRQALLGRKVPEPEKSKHASWLGRKHSEETKAKIRASNIATKALQKAARSACQEVSI